MERDEYIWNGSTPTEIAQHLKLFLPDFGDLDPQELLVLQESAYDHYMKSNKQHKSIMPSSSSSYNMESQMDHDEALARALEMEMEMEMNDLGFDHLHISPPLGDTDNTRLNATKPNVEAFAEQDDIDPDKMTYEQLQSLGDAVGHESKGLSEELISRLPTFKYKLGSSNIPKECAICLNEFKEGEDVANLPCAHSYHSNCITKSLEVKKECPVCQNEVQEQ